MEGLRIGRILGIETRIHWTQLLVFVLVVWNLGAGPFVQWHPQWPAHVRWATAAMVGLLLLASVLAHELAHAWLAKIRGLAVRRITLVLFGGVSNIDREPPSPSAEFLMAIAGPAASILLGIVSLGLGAIVAGPDPNLFNDPTALLARLDPFSTLVLFLGPINLTVGLFNLLPGFPLDGGRIVRSILWALNRDLRKATRWAAATGKVLAWLFVLGGIAVVFGVPLSIFGAGLINGIWLGFIGWFLYSLAQSSYRQMVTKELLEEVPVYRLMRLDVSAVSPDLRVSALVSDWMMGTDELAFPVVDHGEMLGLVAVEDVRKVKRAAWETAVVGDIMTPTEELAVIAPREDLLHALDKLAGRDLRQMPVVEQGRLIGILRRGDIVKWLRFQSRFA